MNLKLQDKIIVVTGGAKGIGEGIVQVLAGEGAIPVIVGRSEADNNATVLKITKAGGKGFQIVAELSNPDECKHAVEKIAKQLVRSMDW